MVHHVFFQLLQHYAAQQSNLDAIFAASRSVHVQRHKVSTHYQGVSYRQPIMTQSKIEHLEAQRRMTEASNKDLINYVR